MATNMWSADRDVPCVYIEYTPYTFSQRLHFHLYHSQLEEPKEEIHKAIKYIGTKHFKWEILEETENEDDAKELVKYYIKEYKADTLGYNVVHNEAISDENSPRTGDHRTWEEIYGKEKADELKKKHSETMKNRKIMSIHNKKRMEVWNPMDDPAVREKERQSKLGTKNPNAVYDYILTKDDGTEIRIECIREFCRENKGFSKNGIIKAIREKRKYKGMTIYKKLKT